MWCWPPLFNTQGASRGGEDGLLGGGGGEEGEGLQGEGVLIVPEDVGSVAAAALLQVGGLRAGMLPATENRRHVGVHAWLKEFGGLRCCQATCCRRHPGRLLPLLVLLLLACLASCSCKAHLAYAHDADGRALVPICPPQEIKRGGVVDASHQGLLLLLAALGPPELAQVGADDYKWWLS